MGWVVGCFGGFGLGFGVWLGLDDWFLFLVLDDCDWVLWFRLFYCLFVLLVLLDGL